MSATGAHETVSDSSATGLVPALLVPGVLLAVEIMGLTLALEPTAGPLAHPGLPRAVTALAMAAATYLILSWHDLAALARDWPAEDSRAGLWLCVHLGLFGAFAGFSVLLDEWAPGGLPALAGVIGWGVLAGLVALSAGLVTLTPGFLAACLRRTRGRLLASLGAGAALAVGGLGMLALWPRACGPAVDLTAALARRTLGSAVRTTGPGGMPVVGTDTLQLLVMPGCSELDALLMFWLLLAAVAIQGRRRLRPARLALVVVLGTALLYVLNAVRLLGLVLAGLALQPQASTWLAHSRVSAFGFLALEAALVLLARRWFLAPPADPAPGTQAGLAGAVPDAGGLE